LQKSLCAGLTLRSLVSGNNRAIPPYFEPVGMSSRQVPMHDLLDHQCYHRPDFPASRSDVYGHGELQRDGNYTPCPGLLLD
jgi:hypothetical protein